MVQQQSIPNLSMGLIETAFLLRLSRITIAKIGYCANSPTILCLPLWGTVQASIFISNFHRDLVAFFCPGLNPNLTVVQKETAKRDALLPEIQATWTFLCTKTAP